jgi:hypothetical protein
VNPDNEIPTFDMADVSDLTAWFQARWPHLRNDYCQTLAADLCRDYTLISNIEVTS